MPYTMKSSINDSCVSILKSKDNLIEKTTHQIYRDIKYTKNPKLSLIHLAVGILCGGLSVLCERYIRSMGKIDELAILVYFSMWVLSLICLIELTFCSLILIATFTKPKSTKYTETMNLSFISSLIDINEVILSVFFGLLFLDKGLKELQIIQNFYTFHSDNGNYLTSSLNFVLTNTDLAAWFIGLFALKGVLIFAANFNIREQTLLYKIIENNKKAALLIKLNELVGAGENEVITSICSKIMAKFGKDDDKIHIRDMRSVLEEKELKMLFTIADPDGNMTITSDEIINFYSKTINERECIGKGLTQEVRSLNTLSGVLNFILLICFIFIVLADKKDDVTKKFIGWVSVLLSGGYIFADTIKMFISSFTFVFFKRPYSIGDMVKIKKYIMRVEEISLLKTIFSHEDLKMIFPNDKLNEEPITNFTSSKSFIDQFTYVFNTKEFIDKSDSLKNAMTIYSKRHATVFSSLPLFTDVTLKSDSEVRVTILVGFSLEYVDYEVALQRRNTFVLVLYQIFNEIKLVPTGN